MIFLLVPSWNSCKFVCVFLINLKWLYFHFFYSWFWVHFNNVLLFCSVSESGSFFLNFFLHFFFNLLFSDLNQLETHNYVEESDDTHSRCFKCGFPWYTFHPASRQSPINIETSRTVLQKYFAPFYFLNANRHPVSMRIVNSCHTVQYFSIYSSDDHRPVIFGGPLKHKYVLDHFHFHWGKRHDHGSEHLINGVRSAMELHLVFYDIRYKSLKEATKRKDENSIAVIGVLFNYGHGEMYPFLTRKLSEIQKCGAKVVVHNTFSILAVIGATPTRFVSYEGSLTTEPFSENVIWIVSMDQREVDPNVLERFRQIQDTDGSKILENWRKSQALNRRKLKMFINSNWEKSKKVFGWLPRYSKWGVKCSRRKLTSFFYYAIRWKNKDGNYVYMCSKMKMSRFPL